VRGLRREELTSAQTAGSPAARLVRGAPDGVDLHRFLGYSRFPPDLLPAFAAIVAGFQSITRHVAARVLADRRGA
jgi:hypothetical protein